MLGTSYHGSYGVWVHFDGFSLILPQCHDSERVPGAVLQVVDQRRQVWRGQFRNWKRKRESFIIIVGRVVIRIFSPAEL